MNKWSYAVRALAAVTLVACAVEKKPPVPESAKAVAQAYVGAWNKHDSVAIDSLLAPDAIHEDIAQNFRGTGRAEVVDFMRKTIAAEPDFKWQVTNSIEDGRHVALEWTWTATYTGPDPIGQAGHEQAYFRQRGHVRRSGESERSKGFTDYWDVGERFPLTAWIPHQGNRG